MALTPTVLIATDALLKGTGFAANSTMLGLVSNIGSLATVSNCRTLLGTTKFYSNSYSILSTLPTGVYLAGNVTANITSQANTLLPPGVDGIKVFINLFSVAGSFISMSKQTSDAVSAVQGKSLSEAGVGVSNFSGMTSGGVNSLFPKLSGAAALNAATDKLAADLGNFGTLYDFKELGTLGPKNLIASLQKQGLTKTTGIEQGFTDAGFNIANVRNIADNDIENILAKVSGAELQKILTLTNATSTSKLIDGRDLLKVQNFITNESLTNMSISDRTTASMSALSNSFINLGNPRELPKYISLLQNTHNQDFTALNSLTTMMPASVAASITSQLGTGTGPNGTPILADMLGTLAGNVHVQQLGNVYSAITALESTSAGQGLVANMALLVTAINGGVLTDIANAQANLSSAVSTANSYITSNVTLSSLITSSSTAITLCEAQIAKEKSNMTAAGQPLTSPVPPSPGISSIMSFAGQLNDLGIDKKNIGTSDFFNQIADSTMGGEAIKAALLEGKNKAASGS
jgi:hypothetical protein